jgi:signal transduction histidine kinase/CheY-like chemotaxis protein
MSETRDGRASSEATLPQRLLAEQIRMIVLQTPQGVAGPAALAVIGAFLLWDRVSPGPLALTLAALFGVLASWIRFYLAFRRENPSPNEAARWARGTFFRTAAHGCCWGAFSLVAFRSDSSIHQSVDVAFMYGLVAGAVVVDGPHFRSFVAFALPTLTPVVIRCFIEGTSESIGIGAAGLVGLGHGMFAALNASRLTVTSIRSSLENADLVRELGRQTEVTERARGDAEAANREKSRFLAAASHDLRQPVHALGLLAAAARRASSEAERGSIIEHIAESVVSLSALFDSLLEISRLDAGVLEPRIVTVQVLGTLQRLATEFTGEAHEKKLDFRLRTRNLAVRTDPVLLERLLRNLLSNAVRYTEKGGILLACRRRGASVRIEVWDTGIGIEPAQRAQVFEPFYQVANPERDRRCGVGLGLAIAQRIAAMLGFGLELSSRPGRGSRFAIELPESIGSGALETGTQPVLALDGSLLGVVVVVIDDEPSVLSAIELLLAQHGCKVVTAHSAGQARQELDDGELVPELLLADLRLSGAETGLGAIARLRSVYGEAVRAAIVTGDTAPERLLEIKASGLRVLHKPVQPLELERTLRELMTERSAFELGKTALPVA